MNTEFHRNPDSLSPNSYSPNDDSDDELYFAEEVEFAPLDQSWKILIVDDDLEVHEVTKLALSDVTFEGKALSFISAYSAATAKDLLVAHPDIAIIFLDVVMETENAGLQLINYIRQDLGNSIARIILRTGQPGQAPENVVAVHYGIDDYKLKTELTSQKLTLGVITALRTFSTLQQMVEIRRDLEIRASQYEQTAITLRRSQQQERAKVEALERSLQSLQQTPWQLSQQDKIETLGQLVSEMTHDLMSTSSSTRSLQTTALITRIARMVLRIMDDHAAKLGISQSKLAVLMYLNSQRDRSASPSILAKHGGVSRAAMTGLLDSLEQEGYVERVSHPSDRRALSIKLTILGQAFLNNLTPPQPDSSTPDLPAANSPNLSDLFSKLDDPERQELLNLVMKVIQLLDDQTEAIG